jgi:ABC-type transport system involved in multi-copper enzyme maturation permease subunit
MGPLFYYELVRLARKGRSTVLRCAYALAGLVALFFVYHERFPSHDLWNAPFSPDVTLGVRDLAGLSRYFVGALLWAQTAAVVVLTPAYLAGAIADERERGTLDLLLTTRLSDREIVLGKLAARLTHLGGILLAGLPLLAATQLWGGVELRVLLAAFAVTGLNLLTVGAISVFQSVRSRTAWAATASSYVVVALLCGTCLDLPAGAPIYAFEMTDGKLVSWGGTDITYLLFWCATAGQVAVVLFCLVVAIYRLRSEKTSPARDAGKKAAQAEPPADKGATVPARPGRQSPPVGDHPLLWLEVYHSPRSERPEENTRVGKLVVVTGFVGLLAFIRLCGRPGDARAVSAALHLGLLGLAACWCVATGSRAAGSLGLERGRQTLDGLLTLPCDRSAVLGAKWLGSILRTADVGVLASTVGLMGLLSGALHPLAVPLLAVSVAGQLCFWASLGVWLSTVFRSTLRARVALALAVLLVFCGSWFLAAGDPPFAPPGRDGDFATTNWWEPLPGAVRAYSANPLRSWWYLAFRWWRNEESEETEVREARFFGVQLAAVAGGTLAFTLAAGLLWLDACRRFRKE